MRPDASTMRHPRGRESLLAVGDLPEDTTKAPTWLIEDVRKSGVLQSILVADNGDEGYVIVDGRRRLAAAREVGLERIPARVFDGAEIGDNIPELAVSLNSLRAANWVTAYESVSKMAMDGLDIDEIGRRTALTVPTVRALLGISTVHNAILKAMAHGTVRYSVVRMIARCGRETQMRLVNEVLFERGTITARDVRTIAPEFAEQKQGELPEAWVVRARHALEALVADAPASASPPLMSAMRRAIRLIQEER